MAFPSFIQLFVVPIILPLLPPAAVMFITDTEEPAIEKSVEEFTSSQEAESQEHSESEEESES